MIQKILETLFSSKNSFFLSPLIQLLVSLRILSFWEGVYNSWEEAPNDDDIFKGTIWVGQVEDRAKKDIAAYNRCKIVPPPLILDYILPVVGGMLLPSKKKLCVIDFGGGMGASYFPLISSIPHPEKIEFHIIEGKKICERGQKILKQFTNLHFHTQLPNLSKTVDIVHAGSSIQYVKNWKLLLKELTDYQPSLLVLEDLMAGNIPSFVTIQNHYGRKARTWFLNINELIEEIEALGYRMTYKSRYTRKILGKVGPLKMKNFSSQYRLDYGSHLMFERIKI